MPKLRLSESEDDCAKTGGRAVVANRSSRSCSKGDTRMLSMLVQQFRAGEERKAGRVGMGSCVDGYLGR